MSETDKMPVGVYAAFSVGKWQGTDDDKYSLTLMQRPGGPDDPYGGYKEVTSQTREHVPLELDAVMFNGEQVEFGDGKQSYFDESDGGPYRVWPAEDGVVRVEEAEDL